MSVLIPVLILSSICSIPETTSADDRWQLVFEDDFSARTDPTADWTRFGDTSPQTRGREGGGLLLTAPAGQEPPSYSGAVNRLGGSVATDQTVTASLAWRPIGGEPDSP